MNHPYTITRKPWQKPDEGTMEYRGVRVGFDFAVSGPPVVTLDRISRYPAVSALEMIDTEGGPLPSDVDAGLAEWRRRFDALMTRLAGLLARAGEPVPTTTGEGVAVQIGPTLEAACAWVLPGGDMVDGPAIRLAGGAE